MLNKLSLRYALPLWIIFLTGCFTVGEVVFTLNSRESSIQTHFQETLQANGNRLSAQIEQILRSPNNSMSQQQDIKRLFSLYLTGSTTDLILKNNNNEDIESASLHHKRDKSTSASIFNEIKKVSISGANSILFDKQNSSIKGIFAVRMPPKSGELRPNGYGTLVVFISYKKALEEEYLNAYLSIFFRFSALFIIVLAIIGVLRARVIAPVASMTETIKKISNGNSTARMKVIAQDELGEIATSFNQMLQTLNRQKQELEDYKNNLEQQVTLEIAKRHEQEGVMMQQSRLVGMGEMIGNIAHQWRQPLNILSLIIINIEDAYIYGELTKEMLEKETKQASEVIQKMSTTIDDFRNYFKPDKQMVSFNMLEIVTDTFSLIEPTFNYKGIKVTIEIDPSIETVGYKNEFSQVIINLLNNASDVLEERHIKDGKIQILAVKNPKEIVLYIKDNGGGIPTDVLPRIFDPYFSTKEEGKGTGIGLYMSKTIIDEHHRGTLTGSNDQNGAVFTVTLPVIQNLEPSI